MPIITMLPKLKQIILFVACFALNSNCIDNNVCSDIKDYYTLKDNPNCWYDIAAEGNIIDIIISYGYPVEQHTVVTVDGYILTMFRIPNNQFVEEETPRKGPVFIHHGWLTSAASFVGLGNRSLAFTLADAGYDVWLANCRGTEYSEGHVDLTVYDKEYWDYGFDEIALYDIPAQLEYIVSSTGERGNIVYIGHSMGTLVGFMYGAALPKKAEETVKLFIFLAPGGQLYNSKSIFVRSLPAFMPAFMKVVEHAGLIRLLSHTSILRTISRILCLKSPLLMEGCLQIANILALGPKDQIDASSLPVIYNQVPTGMSLKLLRHTVGVQKYGLSRYDYGLKNILVYGTLHPPLYDVSRIEVPVLMVYSLGDWFLTKEDALETYSRLSPKAKIYGIREISKFNFNHMDYLYGKHARSIVYEPILQLLEQLK